MQEKYDYKNYPCSEDNMKAEIATAAISETEVKVVLTFNQLDIESGLFYRINKIVSLNTQFLTEIELSPRKFIDRDDRFGLIHSDP